jgi:hypothetical protein
MFSFIWKRNLCYLPVENGLKIRTCVIDMQIVTWYVFVILIFRDL